jgi:hypothetical protein
MVPHYFLPDEPDALEFVKKLYNEVKYRVDNKIAAVPNEKYRMTFGMLPPWHTLKIFDDYAEKFGIASVMESEPYQIADPMPEEELVNDPLELLSRYHYHTRQLGIDLARELDYGPTFFTSAHIGYARDYKADGYMAHVLMSCRSMSCTLIHQTNILMKHFKIPSLVVYGDIVDFKVFNEEETLSRMGTFVETMDHYREVRKKEGFDW